MKYEVLIPVACFFVGLIVGYIITKPVACFFVGLIVGYIITKILGKW